MSFAINQERRIEMTAVDTLRKWIQESDRIVFFGGAGVSTESGIPDFRSVDGLYNQQYKYPPETIISHSFYKKNPKEFYRFYKDRMIYQDAKPNKAHYALAKLEQQGKLSAVITQNIDPHVPRHLPTPTPFFCGHLLPKRSKLRLDALSRKYQPQIGRAHV